MSAESSKKDGYDAPVVIAFILLGVFTIGLLAFIAASPKKRAAAEELKVAEVAEKPTAQAIRTSALAWLRANLHDDESLKDVMWSDVFETDRGDFGVTVQYRAKNPMGAYVLTRRVFGFDRNGELIGQREAK